MEDFAAFFAHEVADLATPIADCSDGGIESGEEAEEGGRSICCTLLCKEATPRVQVAPPRVQSTQRKPRKQGHHQRRPRANSAVPRGALTLPLVMLKALAAAECPGILP